MNKNIIKLTMLFFTIMILTFVKINVNAVQTNSLNITTIGLEKLTVSQNIKDNNLKFNIKSDFIDEIKSIKVKVEYYTDKNVLLNNKTNEFIVQNSTVVELSGKNAIDTSNLKEGDYTIVITFNVDDKQEIKNISLKVVPAFRNIILKVEDNFKKDYTHGNTQPVIIPVKAYGIDIDGNEYQIIDDLLEIEATFCNTMSLKLWNNNGIYTLSLNCADLDMSVGEYEIVFTARKYEDINKTNILYEATKSTKLSIIKSVSSISFKNDKIEIEKGKNKKLDLQISPKDAQKSEIKWISQNENIAMVEDGEVTGINIGSTIISVEIDGKIADILVIVKPTVLIEDINIKDIIDSLDDQNQGKITLETNKNLSINQEILLALGINRQKDLLIVCKEDDKVKYSWTFHGTYIKDKNFYNIPLEINTSTNAPENIKGDLERKINNDVMYLNFKNEGEIPCDVDISVYVGDKYNSGDKVLLYYYNEESKELELKSKKLVVNDNGMITFEIDHCSTYVVSDKILFKNNTIKYIITIASILLITIIIYYIIKRKKRYVY